MREERRQNDYSEVSKSSSLWMKVEEVKKQMSRWPWQENEFWIHSSTKISIQRLAEMSTKTNEHHDGLEQSVVIDDESNSLSVVLQVLPQMCSKQRDSNRVSTTSLSLSRLLCYLSCNHQGWNHLHSMRWCLTKLRCFYSSLSNLKGRKWIEKCREDRSYPCENRFLNRFVFDRRSLSFVVWNSADVSSSLVVAAAVAVVAVVAVAAAAGGVSDLRPELHHPIPLKHRSISQCRAKKFIDGTFS